MKKIISILIIIAALGIGTWLFFSKRDAKDEPLPTASCGDDLCSPVEQKDDLCPQDCKKETSAIQSGMTDFHKLATGRSYANILKLFNPIIDERNRKLYVVGSKTTNVGVIDLNKDELVDTFDIGIFGGFLIFNDQKLYSFDFGRNKCYAIDTENKKATEISFDTCTSLAPQDKGQPKKSGAYSFLETGYQSFADGTTGFPTDWTQNLNGAYGVIEISDSAGKKVGEIIHGPDANFFTIDTKTNKLYTTNTGDGSLSVFDLNKLESTNFCEKNSCLVKEINIGDSADQVIADSAGNLYIRNRLGGSTIFKYNQSVKTLAIIENENSLSKNATIWNNNWSGEMALGMWPTDMALSKDEKRLYVLSHYGALIDIVDTPSNKVIAKIKFDTTLKPRTDSISVMALDKSRDRIYAAWPELGLITIADGKSQKVLGTIDLAQSGFDRAKAANGGPGLISIAVSEKDNTLFVYLFNEKKLLAFDGDTFQKKKEVAVTENEKREKILMVNPDKKELYLGKTVLNLDTLEKSGSFSRGQKVEAIDAATGSVYLKDLLADKNSKNKMSLKIFEYSDGTAKKEWTIYGLGEIANTFFDFKNNVFYVADFLTGSVIKKDLASGSAPSAAPANPASTDAKKPIPPTTPSQTPTPPTIPTTAPPIVPTQGKCGDGICQPIEREKGVCKEDCK
jgi:DNA-binding beta-propeller fold protein YncE